MARQSKTKTTETVVPPVPATSTPAPVAEKKVKAVKTESTATASASVVAPVVEPTDAVEPEVVEFGEEVVSAQVAEYISTISRLTSELTALKKSLVEFDKKTAKGIKVLKKRVGKRHRKTDGVPRQSGFTKPVKVTPEFAAILGISADELISRTEACKKLSAYFREHKLTEGRVIHYKNDPKLASLIVYSGEKPFQFLNLQKAIKHLFVKDTPVA